MLNGGVEMREGVGQEPTDGPRSGRGAITAM